MSIFVPKNDEQNSKINYYFTLLLPFWRHVRLLRNKIDHFFENQFCCKLKQIGEEKERTEEERKKLLETENKSKKKLIRDCGFFSQLPFHFSTGRSISSKLWSYNGEIGSSVGSAYFSKYLFNELKNYIRFLFTKCI